MYCPRCGHQTTSEELRFCSYCGLKLGVIKASLSETEDVVPSTVLPAVTLPRQRDINVGVILIFAGALVASFITGWRPGINRTSGAVLLVLEYLILVALSLPITKGILKLLSWESDTTVSSSRKGLNIGATLMLASTFLLSLVSFFMFGRMKTSAFYAGLVVVFTLLLFVSRQFLRGLQYLVFDETPISTSEHNPTIAAGVDRQTLTAGQGTPIPIFGAQRVTTAEIVAPSSITEHTTNLLE